MALSDFHNILAFILVEPTPIGYRIWSRKTGFESQQAAALLVV
ncbi:hypothetical protein SEA_PAULODIABOLI_191 [Microbacterium phage PauloDiaboli]|nr:hypothetical protein SEA_PAULODIABOLI_191 [Microbacterium phage PauloDiaboli]QWY83999.1 hypothetical protein SEA_A3WALLY_192 [Microbacterium phage A3Wally]